MRLAGIVVAFALICVAGLQSFIGGTAESDADDRIVLAASDLCVVEAATLPVLGKEERQFTLTPAYKELVVTPARFGTRTDTVTVVPAHREGATFLDEEKRVVISEPTRRLRAIDPTFGPALVVESRDVIRYRVEAGALVKETETLPPFPEGVVVTKEARIQAVRVNAGLRMLDVQVIDTDGDGDPVPAETVEIKVRTVEEKPAVETSIIPAVTEMATVDIVETPSTLVEAEAVCDPAAHGALLARVREALVARGVAPGPDDGWTPATIDAIAAAQVSETGLVSPHLLLESLRLWIPDIGLPVS